MTIRSISAWRSRVPLVVAAIGVLSAAACLHARSIADQVPMDATARTYLTIALDSLQRASRHRDTFRWTELRDSVFARARGARTPAETHDALAWAMRRVDPHSFFVRPRRAPAGGSSTAGNAPRAPDPMPSARLIAGRFGYLHLPSTGGTAQSYADSSVLHLAAQRAAGACGWIVDVRGNGGGNMWPMLASVSPLLGDTLVGWFLRPSSRTYWWNVDGAVGTQDVGGVRRDTASRVTVAAERVDLGRAPVAILTDSVTASAAEAVVVAFLGRPDTRLFGAPTRGLSTANRGVQLSDGAFLVVTSAVYADRRLVTYGSRIVPDEPVRPDSSADDSTADRVVESAVTWLRARPACS